MFVLVPTKKLFLYYTISPLVFAITGFIIFNKFFVVLIGLVLGFILPGLIIKNLEARRKKKFKTQLLDALMTLSSSFKGGLSLLQAIELLVEEMPPPISQEFSLVLRENKIGVSLEESLNRLNRRIALEELELVVSSILVSRETGGDLTKVFSRLANSMRDKRKIQEQIKTLTLQGRMQGFIMSFLPIAFTIWVVSINRHHFDVMFSSELGRMLLIAAVFLQIIGMFLIKKFSTINM